jgi:very-short-patch-repair endonuclease
LNPHSQYSTPVKSVGLCYAVAVGWGGWKHTVSPVGETPYHKVWRGAENLCYHEPMILRGRRSPKYPYKLQRAREMRQSPTFTEAIMWKHLRARRLGRLKFRRQAIILGWIVDFYCPERKLVVEIDGNGHDPHADSRRDTVMRDKGLTVLRFTNDDVILREKQVLNTILRS